MAVAPVLFVSPSLSPAAVARLALESWLREVCPHAVAATLVITYADGECAGIDARLPNPNAWVRWPGFPRAGGAAVRLAETVRRAFPDAVTADVVFTTGRGREGTFPVPI